MGREGETNEQGRERRNKRWGGVRVMGEIEKLKTAEEVGNVERSYETVATKYGSTLYYIEGEFVMKPGTVIVYPDEKTKNGGKSGKDFYGRTYRLIAEGVTNGEIGEIDGELQLISGLVFDNPSVPAGLVSGTLRNGWTFYRGISAVRDEHVRVQWSRK